MAERIISGSGTHFGLHLECPDAFSFHSNLVYIPPTTFRDTVEGISNKVGILGYLWWLYVIMLRGFIST